MHLICEYQWGTSIHQKTLAISIILYLIHRNKWSILVCDTPHASLSLFLWALALSNGFGMTLDCTIDAQRTTPLTFCPCIYVWINSFTFFPLTMIRSSYFTYLISWYSFRTPHAASVLHTLLMIDRDVKSPSAHVLFTNLSCSQVISNRCLPVLHNSPSGLQVTFDIDQDQWRKCFSLWD